MPDFKIGDVVSRKSYDSDILFKVVDIKKEGDKKIIVLKGICFRLEADAPETDLVIRTDDYVREYNDRINRGIELKVQNINDSKDKIIKKKFYYRYTVREEKKFSKPGKILHIDGDKEYLNKCIEEYKKSNIECIGIYLREKDQPSKVYQLLTEYTPEILVLTGHDGFLKNNKGYASIDNYRNSKYYVQSVKEARRFEPSLDSLVIFAGACQSMYHKLIEAGANYASSPYRVLIHALDPVLVCSKVALTSVGKIINPQDVVFKTITGFKGIGGIETRGKYREGYPLEPYNN